MVARYGDFVLYQPPVKATTVLLWAGPRCCCSLGVRRPRRASCARAAPAEAPPLTAEERERAARLLAGDDGKGRRVITFVLIAAAMVAVALAWVLVPLLRGAAGRGVAREASNVAILRDQLRELDADLATGTMPREQYEQARRELEQRVLEESKAPARSPAAPSARRRVDRGDPRQRAPDRGAAALRRARQPRRVLAAGARRRGEAGGAEHEVTPEQVEAMAAKLAAQAREGAGQRRRLGDARAHLLRAQPLSPRPRARSSAPSRSCPDNADLLADYADALGAAQGGTLAGKPLELIERALKADPTHWKALALAGTAAFDRKDYTQAVAYWERMKATVPAGSPIAQIDRRQHRRGARAGRAQGRPRHRPPPRRRRRPAPAPRRRRAAAPVRRPPARRRAGRDDRRHRDARARARREGLARPTSSSSSRARPRARRCRSRSCSKQVQGPARSRSRSTTRWRWRRNFALSKFPPGRRRRARLEIGQRNAAERRPRGPVSPPVKIGATRPHRRHRPHAALTRRQARAPMNPPGASTSLRSSSARASPGLVAAFGLQRRGASVEVLDAGAARRRRHRHAPSRRRALRDRPQQHARHDAAHQRAARRARHPRRARRRERRRRDALHRARRQARRAADVARRTSRDARVLARREAAPLREPFIAPRARRRRGIDRRVRPPPARRRVPRLRDRPVRLRRLRRRPGADLGVRRVSAPARARAEVRQPDQGPDPGRARAQASARDGEEHRGQLLVSRRHADADRRARRARSAASRPASRARASSAVPTASGRSPARATASRSLRRAKAVVLAVPALRGRRRSCASSRPPAAQGLAAIEYAPIASVATAYRRADIAHSLAGFGFLVPKKEQRRILGSLFSSSMFEGRAPRGHRAATTFVGGMRQPGAAGASPTASSATLVHAELAALVGATHPPAVDRRSRAGRARFRSTTSAIASACARSRTPSARARDSSSAPTTAAACRSATASSRRTRRPTPPRASWSASERRRGRAPRRHRRAAALPAQVERRRRLLAAARRSDASAGALASSSIRAQHRVARSRSCVVVEPHLRLRDVGRHVADDARRVLVEHVRLMPACARRSASRYASKRCGAMKKRMHRSAPAGRREQRVDEPLAAPRRAAPRAPGPTRTAAPRPCSTPAPSRAAARGRRAPGAP